MTSSNYLILSSIIFSIGFLGIFVNRKNIIISRVPGSFELVYGSKELSKKNLDAVIAIGCVIKGETDHYEFICSSVSNGLMQLNKSGSTPVIFCVLTDHKKQDILFLNVF